MTKREIFISVDIEAAGPVPGKYSLMSIGACRVDDPQKTFSKLLKPINREADPAAMKISGMSFEMLERDGAPPADAMQSFADWLDDLKIEPNDKIVFVGLNAPFDWSFVNYYFHVYLGGNPFGFTALDIKAYYMGVTGCIWSDTGSSDMSEWVKPKRKPDHDAVHDAQYQAELFALIRAKAEQKRLGV